jgi:hypothetical protein
MLSAMPRLDWTREEIILAMDLYVMLGADAGGSIPGKTSAVITQLSAQLRKLSAYPPERQDEKYRNPDGVYLNVALHVRIDTRCSKYGREGPILIGLKVRLE